MKFILLAFIVGCGNSENLSLSCDDTTTIVGINICWDTDKLVDVTIIPSILNIVEKHTNLYYPQVINFENTAIRGKLIIMLTDRDIKINCTNIVSDGNNTNVYVCDQETTGINANGFFIAVEVTDSCLADTSLIHELLHLVEWIYLTEEYKPLHETPNLFNGVSAVEITAKREARLLCN